MRVPNSGTASPRDIDLGWEQLQAAALQTLVLERNARPDGRGLSDLRELRCEVGITQLHSHGFWIQWHERCHWRQAALLHVLMLRGAATSGHQYQTLQ